MRFRFGSPALLVLAAGIGCAQTFDRSRLDTSVAPCADFFQYANGGLLAKLEIPPDRPSYGSFAKLAEDNREVLRGILEAAAGDRGKAPRGSATSLIGHYYGSCMGEDALEAAGTRPIQPLLERIAGLRTAAGLQPVLAALHEAGIPAVFAFGSSTDMKNSARVIAAAAQGGLSLPNADYYTRTDAGSVATRRGFAEHVGRMLRLLGDSEEAAAAAAETVLRLETRLARASLSPVESRDANNRYNKIPLAQADALTPGWSWTAYLKARRAPAVPEINIAPAKFFREFQAMLGDVPVAEWRTYLRWYVLHRAAPRLSRAFFAEDFRFFQTTLGGATEPPPRWRTCVTATDEALGEALGQEYVKRTFPPAARDRMNAMIDDLIAAFRDRLRHAEWLSEATRTQALAKLDTFRRKIGYPEKPRGYPGLHLVPAGYFDNWMRVERFAEARDIADIGQPVDRTRWRMSAPTVNASYSSTFNEITFPAGILQPPFFDLAAGDAQNYGAIGAVIGHEITHGFDDAGSRFDRDGNLKTWWTAEDRRKFDERAQCVVEQFNAFEVLPGLTINGKLTLGENIADLGGLTIAYQAFRKAMERKPLAPPADGFTAGQQFFLGFAQVWASKYRPEALRRQVLGDPHANARFRVNGTVSNLPEFQEAFSCKPSDPMVRAQRCRVW